MADTGITEVEVSAYEIPTAVRESDATAEWKSIGLVVVEVAARDKKGLGYTYTDPEAARLVKDMLAGVVRGIDPFDTAAVQVAMLRALRNHGPGGLARMAMSAVDRACWDLKARILERPFFRLLGSDSRNWASPGSRSRARAPTSPVCASCATALPPGWRSPGESFGYEPADFRRFLEAQALDVVQAGVTRCGGITGFLRNAGQIESYDLPVSCQWAPALHIALGCAVQAVRHVEWFVDYAIVEQELFDGAPKPEKGELKPDPQEPALGLTFKRGEAAQYRVRI